MGGVEDRGVRGMREGGEGRGERWCGGGGEGGGRTSCSSVVRSSASAMSIVRWRLTSGPLLLPPPCNPLPGISVGIGCIVSSQPSDSCAHSGSSGAPAVRLSAAIISASSPPSAAAAGDAAEQEVEGPAPPHPPPHPPRPGTSALYNDGAALYRGMSGNGFCLVGTASPGWAATRCSRWRAVCTSRRISW